MAIEIPIKHNESGLLKTGVHGFSWTYLFFGFFVPLFRGETQTAFIHLILQVITGGIWQIYCCFVYNKNYMTRMLTSGWELDGSEDQNRIAATELGIAYESKDLKVEKTSSVKEVTTESPEDKLQKLGDLKEKGLLTEDEFNSKKAEILKEM
jgi:hypothetical protein|tara:strand:- start:387 stop:842 length:456 start_codon:yes stop_codon:yes gene_type:complete